MQPDHFFQPTPFIRNALVPVLVLFGAGMPFLVPEWTLARALLVAALSITSFLYAAALMWPERVRWAGRAVAGMVFVFYTWYAVSEWFFSDHAFRFDEAFSRASPRNALLGLLLIGVPCLIYAIRGPRPDALDDIDEDDLEDDDH